MIDTRKLSLKLESTLDSVEASELIVQRMAQLNGFDEEQVHHIGMAVREAVANAVAHGNCYNCDKSVFFEASVDSKAFRVTVMDQGEGFSPDAVPDPLAPENILKDSGRGLLLINAFFDEVTMEPEHPHGTRVVLVKYRSSSES